MFTSLYSSLADAAHVLRKPAAFLSTNMRQTLYTVQLLIHENAENAGVLRLATFFGRLAQRSLLSFPS